MKRALLIVCLFLVAAVGASAQIGIPWPGPGSGVTGTCNTTKIFLTTTGAGTWVNSTGCSLFNVAVIGAGGGGAGGTNNSNAGRPGCGGAYSGIVNQTLGGGASFAYSVGAKGTGGAAGTNGTTGGDSWFCSATTSCASIGDTNSIVGAKGGGAGNTGSTCTQALAASGVGTTKFNGGAGPNLVAAYASPGAGAAAGPSGAGASGGADAGSAANAAAGGGGGADGGSAGSAGTSGGPAGAGGAGANSGGSGGAGSTFQSAVTASPGAIGTEWDASHGAGGGGGGGGFVNSTGHGYDGGAGGLYGGGGGAGGIAVGSTPGVGADAAQGIIVISPLSFNLTPANDNAPIRKVA